MECIYCNSYNIEGALFCRNCGKELSGGRNIIESFPEYDFVPTSLPFFSIKQYNTRKILALLGIIISIISELLIYYWSTLGDYVSIFFHFIWGTLFLISIIVLFIPSKKGKSFDLPLIADYVQDIRTNRSRYIFFCKGHRMGVLDFKGKKIQIPAKYDSLSWKKQQEIIVARTGNKSIYIDIHGKELK